MNRPELDTDAAHDGRTKTITRRRFVGAATAAALLSGAGARVLGSPDAGEATTAGGVKLFSRFTRLPGRSIAPDGWLLQYAQINANAWVLKYAKDRMPSVWGRYVNRTSNPDLGFTDHDEWKDAPDYGAYFGDSLVHYGGLFQDSAVSEEAQNWAARLIASQDADGYVGAFTFEARWRCWLEIFHQSLLIDALLYRYDIANDTAALATCERAAERIMQTWYHPPEKTEMGIFSGHGTVIVRSMGKLYAITGKDSYRKFAQEIMPQFKP